MNNLLFKRWGSVDGFLPRSLIIPSTWRAPSKIYNLKSWIAGVFILNSKWFLNVNRLLKDIYCIKTKFRQCNNVLSRHCRITCMDQSCGLMLAKNKMLLCLRQLSGILTFMEGEGLWNQAGRGFGLSLWRVLDFYFKLQWVWTQLSFTTPFLSAWGEYNYNWRWRLMKKFEVMG